MTTVVSVVAFIVAGVALLVTLEVVDTLVGKAVRRCRPARPRQHYPGGPYLAADSGAADPRFH